MAEFTARRAIKSFREIARQNPELATLIAGMYEGYHALEITTYEQRTTNQVVDRKFLGLTTGYDVVPITTTVTTRRTMRFY